MNSNRLCFLSLTILIFFAACKKEGNFSAGTTVTTNLPACLITSDVTDQMLTYGNQFTLTYDSNGHVISVLSELSGTNVGTIAVTDKQIVRNQPDAIETFDFSKSIFNGQPDSYTYTNSSSASSNRSAKLTYNGNGKPTKVQTFDAGNNLQGTVDLTYNDNDNLTAITLTAASAGSQPLSYVATGYGTRNSAFYGQPGTNVLFYNWDFYITNDYTYLFEHLSHHNITGWSLTYASGSLTASYNYNSFNDKDYPTDITETVTNTSNNQAPTTTDIEWTYYYDCK